MRLALLGWAKMEGYVNLLVTSSLVVSRKINPRAGELYPVSVYSKANVAEQAGWTRVPNGPIIAIFLTIKWIIKVYRKQSPLFDELVLLNNLAFIYHLFLQ